MTIIRCNTLIFIIVKMRNETPILNHSTNKLRKRVKRKASTFMNMIALIKMRIQRNFYKSEVHGDTNGE